MKCYSVFLGTGL